MSSVPPPSSPGTPPTSGPPVSPYPPFSPDSRYRVSWTPLASTRKTASNLLAAGAVIYALAIPVGLLIFKALVESAAHSSVSWGEIFGALEQTGFLALILGGILAQAIFATLAGIGAFLLRTERPQVATPMIVVGVVAVVFSFAVFGGIVGAIAGFLTIAGGAKGREEPPSPWPPAPPPYVGLPPYRP